MCRFGWSNYTLPYINSGEEHIPQTGIATADQMKKLQESSVDYVLFDEFCGANDDVWLPFVIAP